MGEGRLYETLCKFEAVYQEFMTPFKASKVRLIHNIEKSGALSWKHWQLLFYMKPAQYQV